MYLGTQASRWEAILKIPRLAFGIVRFRNPVVRGIGLLLLLLAGGANSTPEAWAQEEVTLYDRDGRASAYIAVRQDQTIYLWSGEPVAYLRERGQGFTVHGFNGRHLGSFEGGILRDREGYVTGFVRGAASVPLRPEGIKGIKRIRPIRSIPEITGIRPIFRSQFSRVPLAQFLSQGAR
jgi:hypothetical protein